MCASEHIAQTIAAESDAVATLARVDPEQLNVMAADAAATEVSAALRWGRVPSSPCMCMHTSPHEIGLQDPSQAWMDFV